MQGLTAVTGADGFLGRQLCDHLAEQRIGVRRIQRSPNAIQSGWDGCVVGNITDTAALRRAFDGADLVVHLAARVHQGPGDRDTAEHWRVNVEGTNAVLHAARDSGVSRVVVVSSVKAVGESNTTAWSEDVEPRPVDPYGQSKLAAERLALAFSGSSAVETVILRLPLVYGPGVKANMRRMFDLVSRGVPVPLGGIRNRRSLAYSGNVIAAIDLVATAPAAAGEVYFVSDGHDVSTPELLTAVATALGVKPRLLPFPRRLARLAARMGDAVSRYADVPFTTAVLARLTGSLAVSIEKIRRLGYAPRYTLATGLEHTAAWYKSHMDA